MKKGILGLLGAIALFGCGGGGGHSSDDSRARVSFINASPDTSDVEFRLNDDSKADDVDFGTATGFDSINPGDYDAALRPSNGSVDLWSEARTFSSDTDTLALAIGLQTPPSDTTQTPPVVEAEKRIRYAFGTIDRQTPVGNRARIFIVHAFVRQAGYPTPAIDFRNPGDTPSNNVTNVAFGAVSSLDVDSGTQSFEVRQTNTDQVFVAAQSLTFAPGKIYVALVSGEEGLTGTNAPSIRLIPLSTRD